MLKLRELERRDLPFVNGWRRSRELIDCLVAPYRYIGLEMDDVWFDA